MTPRLTWLRILLALARPLGTAKWIPSLSVVRALVGLCTHRELVRARQGGRMGTRCMKCLDWKPLVTTEHIEGANWREWTPEGTRRLVG